MRRKRKLALDLLAAPLDAMPPGTRREAATAYQRLSSEVPAGLHGVLGDLFCSFIAIADCRPPTLFSDLIAEVTPTRVQVGAASDDPVVCGIQRRFNLRAMHSCHRCGRKGHLRKSLGGRVRCARCAAPELMLLEIERLLDRAKRCSRPSRGKIASELPPMLHPVFRAFTCHWADMSHKDPADAAGDIEAAWHRSLQELAHDLRRNCVSPNTACNQR